MIVNQERLKYQKYTVWKRMKYCATKLVVVFARRKCGNKILSDSLTLKI